MSEQIHGKILELMGLVESIEKGQRMEIKKGTWVKYRGIDDILNVLGPLMRNLKIYATPKVREMTREERVTKYGNVQIYTAVVVDYKVYAEDGSFVEAATAGEAFDSGDKSSSKAQSIAYRNLWIELLHIPTEHEDPEQQNVEIKETASVVERIMGMIKGIKTEGQLEKYGKRLNEMEANEELTVPEVKKLRAALAESAMRVGAEA